MKPTGSPCTAFKKNPLQAEKEKKVAYNFEPLHLLQRSEKENKSLEFALVVHERERERERKREGGKKDLTEWQTLSHEDRQQKYEQH